MFEKKENNDFNWSDEMDSPLPNEEELVEQDLYSTLLDENNEDPIILYDEEGKPNKFEQVAVIPLENSIFCILAPADPMEGVEEDEAIVFRLEEDEEGDPCLIIEEDDSVVMAVFDVYYELLKEQGIDVDNLD